MRPLTISNQLNSKTHIITLLYQLHEALELELASKINLPNDVCKHRLLKIPRSYNSILNTHSRGRY